VALLGAGGAVVLLAAAGVSTGVLIAHGSNGNHSSRATTGNLQSRDKTSYSGAPAQSGSGATDQQSGRAVLGVSVDDSNGKVTVKSVVPGSGADKAGIKAGDVITAVDGASIGSLADLQKALSGKKSGDTVTVSIDRNGSKQDLKVTLGSPVRSPSGANIASRAILGVSVANVDDAAKQKYSLNTTDGALITNVNSGGPADKAGLKVGDLITSVNGTAVKNADDLQNAIKNSKPGDSVTVQYQRGGASQSASVTLGSFTGPGGLRPNRPNGGNNGGSNGGNGQSGPGNGPGQGILPLLPRIGGALGGNFDNFISSDVKFKDANGQTHTETVVGGTVQQATSGQAQVNLNGGGSQSYTIDGNTRILKGARGGQQNGGSNTLAANDKVLVITEDGSNTAKTIIVIPNGGFALNPGDLGSSIGDDLNSILGGDLGSIFGGGDGPVQITPGNGGITIRTPQGGNIQIPLPGANGGGGQGQQTY
jgi:membrane-associated protease RseP (regulator of RpoE activity)